MLSAGACVQVEIKTFVEIVLMMPAWILFIIEYHIKWSDPFSPCS